MQRSNAMSNRPRRTLVALLAVLPLAAAIADEGFHCGGKIIETGMTQAEVLKHCGAPTSKTTEAVPVRSGNQVVGTTQSQRWTYSSWSTTRVLVFDQDRLVAIQ
jgi:hypothetical protein